MKARAGIVAWSVGALFALAPAHSADIYRWVDEDGRTHLSDRVPKQYRRSATRVEPDRQQLIPQRERAARARAEREKARAATAAARGASPASRPVSAPAPAVRPPANGSPGCAQLLRRYRESEACFAPFRTATGGVKQEAFDICGAALPEPSGCIRADPQ